MAVTRPVHEIYTARTGLKFTVKLQTADCAEEDLHNTLKSFRMKSEECRLQSYRDWPQWSSQLPERLAEAGLYYTGLADRVQCPFCNGVLKNWNIWDVPMFEHSIHFPYCEFIRGKDVGNIAKGCAAGSNHHIQTLGVSRVGKRSVSKTVDFTKEVNRLGSFRKWPPNRTQTPESLARAGFYHVPSAEKLDRVMCAYCRGKLYGWRFGDDPWLEHARCYPACPYVRLCVGQGIINDLLR